MKALDKTRILAPSDYFYHFLFPRYGRLKSKFLCERYSHCIFSSCSIDLTKTRYTWSLTAVPNHILFSLSQNHRSETVAKGQTNITNAMLKTYHFHCGSCSITNHHHHHHQIQECIVITVQYHLAGSKIS